MARPGGNLTGFIQFEYSLSGKWMELLKGIAPSVRRAAVLRKPGPAGIGQWAIIQAVAQSLGVELKPIGLTNASDIERAISTFASDPNGGMIVVVSAASLDHRNLIVELAAGHRLPTVYAYRVFVTGGGLITYGPDIVSQYRRAAGRQAKLVRSSRCKYGPGGGAERLLVGVNVGDGWNTGRQ